MGRIWIALVDEWGMEEAAPPGPVVEHQWRVARELMDLYQREGIAATFLLEVLQQMACRRHAGLFPEMRRATRLWEETVLEMAERGFDRQVMLHPQWHDAAWDGMRWRLDPRWSLADFSPIELDNFLGGGLAYLRRLLPHHRWCAFRAGAGGACCPSYDLFTQLQRQGLGLDISLTQGNHFDTPHIRLDTRKLASPYAAYYPDYNDVRRRAKHPTRVVEVPLQSVPRREISLKDRLANRIICRLSPRRWWERRHPPPAVAENGEGVQGAAADTGGRPPKKRREVRRSDYVLDLSLPYSLHLWRLVVERAIRRQLERPGEETRYLVFATRSATLVNRSQLLTLAQVLGHIRATFGGQVEWVTLERMEAHIREHGLPEWDGPRAVDEPATETVG